MGIHGFTIVGLVVLLALVGASIYLVDLRGSSDAVNGTLVEVTGSSTVYVMPDQLEIYITISNPRPSDPGAAYGYVSDAVNEFLGSIADTGVNYTTLGFTLNPVYDYPGGSQVLLGYRASYDLRITMDLPTNASLVSRVLSSAAQHGATSIYLAFTLSPSYMESRRNEALSNALSDAMSKVNTVASNLGKSVLYIKSVREVTSTPQPVFLYTTAQAPTPTIPINPGPVSISATVTVDAVIG
jgi:uncharacterized protein YggE